MDTRISRLTLVRWALVLTVPPLGYALALVVRSTGRRVAGDPGRTADLLVVLSTDGLPEPAAQLIRWTQAHAEGLPIGTQIDFVPQGGALSFAPPPGVFGREAIREPLDWLDKRHSPGAPAPMVIAHFKVGLRQSALESRGLRLPSIDSEAARDAGALYP